MRCVECGGVVKPSSAPIETEYRKEILTVLNVPHRQCEECGAVSFYGEEIERYSEAIDAEYRKEKGLLSSAAIRGLRDKYGLTQRELQRLVGVSDPTVSRWETGASPQNETADKLLRVMRDVDGAMEALMAMAGIDPKKVSTTGFDTQWNNEVKAIETGIEWITEKA